jgi:hypothetical protein
MMMQFVSYLTLVAAVCLPFATQAADPQRIAAVAKRGADVMPFDLKATTHVFTKTDTGGVQSVVAKDPGDRAQVDLVRKHLKEIQEQFLKGDFSGPSHIHGREMPGLAQLQSAKPGQIKMAYMDVPGGAQVTYSTSEPELVAALHSWFDAQLSDHGADAMAGHHHDHGAIPKP